MFVATAQRVYIYKYIYIYTVVGASINFADPSFVSDRLASPSLFQAGPVRHRYFNRASVIAILRFVTAILRPSVKKTVYMGNGTQFYSFRNSLGHITQKNMIFYNLNNITAPPASPPQTAPCSWGTPTGTYSPWTPASGSWRWPGLPSSAWGCRRLRRTSSPRQRS